MSRKCPTCGNEVDDGVKFCGECGTKLPPAQPAAEGGGIAIGEKAMVAGDVVGHQEAYKISGNATIVKNEDETRHVVQCHICGKNLQIIDSIVCPECGETTCGDCIDAATKMCNRCAAGKSADKEEIYKKTYRHFAEDGKITMQERKELSALMKQLGIPLTRAFELERIVKSGVDADSSAPAGGLSNFNRLMLKKAEELLYEQGNVEETLKAVQPLYQKNPENEDVLSVYIAALVQADPDEAKKLIRNANADVLCLSLAAVDLDLLDNDYSAAEEHLNAALSLWPESLLLKCRNAICYEAMYRELQDDSLLQMAVEAVSDLPEPQNKLEASWVTKAQSIVFKAMGDDIPDYTQEYCTENGLYYAIVQTETEEERIRKMEEAFEAKDYETLLKLAQPLAENGNADAVAILKKLAKEEENSEAAFLVGKAYKDGLGVPQDSIEARIYLRKAVKIDQNVDAQKQLGFIYRDEIGVQEDYIEAMDWFRAAADQGDSEAKSILAQLEKRFAGETAQWRFQKSVEYAKHEKCKHANTVILPLAEKGNIKALLLQRIHFNSTEDPFDEEEQQAFLELHKKYLPQVIQAAKMEIPKRWGCSNCQQAITSVTTRT